MEKFRRNVAAKGSVSSAGALTVTGNATVGGTLAVTGAITAGGKAVASGTKAAHIVAASTEHALNATFSDTEAEAALNALGTKLNAVIAALDAFGITATS